MNREAYLRKAYPSLAPEIDRLKGLKVPASFYTDMPEFYDDIPDTPLADAARRQIRAAGGAA